MNLDFYDSILNRCDATYDAKTGGAVKAITLRNLPPEIAKTIRKKAQKEGVSINKAVIKLLEEGMGPRNKAKGGKPLYHDLDDLAGSWTQEEASEFDRALAEQRAIDTELWR